MLSVLDIRGFNLDGWMLSNASLHIEADGQISIFVYLPSPTGSESTKTIFVDVGQQRLEFSAERGDLSQIGPIDVPSNGKITFLSEPESTDDSADERELGFVFHALTHENGEALNIEDVLDNLVLNSKALIAEHFDADYYLAQFDQLDVDPLDHFLETGWKAGKNPADWFDCETYLKAYPDVARLAKLNPFGHYLLFGKYEGRVAHKTVTAQATEVDRLEYDQYAMQHYAQKRRVTLPLDTPPTTPSVSIITPCYNCAEYLLDCYNSIITDIGNSDTWEIIFVDDGSSDGTRGIIEDLQTKDKRVRGIFNPKNLGVSATRNVGIDNARMEFVSFIDADDLVGPDTLTALARYVTPDVDFIRGKHVRMNSASHQVSQNPAEEKSISEAISVSVRQLPALVSTYPCWNALYRRDVLNRERIRFPTDISIGEDRIFNLLFFRSCKMCTVLDKYTYFWRVHGTQVTKDLSRRMEAVFAGIAQLSAELAEPAWTDLPEHRAVLATNILVESCNFLTQLSREFDRSAFSNEILSDLAFTLSNLKRGDVDLSRSGIKGFTGIYFPLYRLVENALETTQNLTHMLKAFFKLLGEIRVSAQLGQSQEAAKTEDLAVTASAYGQMRSLRGPDLQRIELDIAQEHGALDEGFYKSQLGSGTDMSRSDLVHHYLTHGVDTDIDPARWLDTSEFFSQGGGAMQSGQNPLVHDLVHRWNGAAPILPVNPLKVEET